MRATRLDVALAALDGETEIGLWLLETVNELEAAETARFDKGCQSNVRSRFASPVTLTSRGRMPS
jgi:hypothetical protein